MQGWFHGYMTYAATQHPMLKGPMLGLMLRCHYLEILNNFTVESMFFDEIQWNKIVHVSEGDMGSVQVPVSCCLGHT